MIGWRFWSRLSGSKPSCLTRAHISYGRSGHKIALTKAEAILRLDQPKVRPEFLHELSEDGLGVSKFWLKALKANNTLLKSPAQRLVQIVEIWQELGAQPQECLEILSRSDLSSFSTLEGYRDNCIEWISFCDSLRVPWAKILTEVPEILLYDPLYWRERESLLRETYFQKKLMRNMILQAPCVLTEDWDLLEEKINYLILTMHASPYQICLSGALVCDIDFLRTRYEFLDRSGLYKHPNPKSLGLDATASPELEKVIVENTHDFLMDACDGLLSMEEYNTYLSLEAIEHQEEREESLKYALNAEDWEQDESDEEVNNPGMYSPSH